MKQFCKNNKGQVRVIEAFFTSILLLSCLALIPAQPAKENISAATLEGLAQNTLLSLDGNGHLANLIDEQDWTGLGACIESVLPLTVWFNLTVSNQNGDPINPYPISNSGQVSNTVTSYSYICASPNSTYTVYVLQLQLAAVD